MGRFETAAGFYHYREPSGGPYTGSHRKRHKQCLNGLLRHAGITRFVESLKQTETAANSWSKKFKKVRRAGRLIQTNRVIALTSICGLRIPP